jgi:hypothetical protein
VFEEAKSSRLAYRLWTAGQPVGDEYFLAEHRSRTGYDALLPGEGLLLYHVDDSAPNNADESRYKVGLLQADNRGDLQQARNRGDDGDPYPGPSQNTGFTDTSTPASRSHAGVSTCVSLSSITAVANGTRCDVSLSCGAISGTTLRRGASGADVERLQRLLARAPTYHRPVDGIFGSRTEAAVKAYQSTRGLVVDGIVGPQTWGALEAEAPSGTEVDGE